MYKKVPNGALDINLKERRRENRRNTEAGRRARMGGGWGRRGRLINQEY